jgi:hypothetical protein
MRLCIKVVYKKSRKEIDKKMSNQICKVKMSISHLYLGSTD